MRFYRETLLPAKLAMNIAYLEHRSVWLDVQLVLRTAFCSAFPGKMNTQQASPLVPEDPK
jgi:lipopolysaccharide/colanic/teichoic acid biosynthesis glycosyltransferase